MVSAGLIFKYFGTPYLLTFLGSCIMYSLFTVHYSDYRRRGVERQKKYERKIEFILSETFVNYHNVKFYSAEEFEALRYLKALDENYKQTN